MFNKGARIVFAGDSITDAGRDRSAMPGGWGFGNGYVNQIHCLLSAIYPDLDYVTINSGVSGDDIMQLSERWQKDVLDLQPDVVSVMIGVNDAWRHFDQPFWAPYRHSVADYEQEYRKLLDTLTPETRIILMSSFMFEANKQEPMRMMVEEFAASSKKLAQEYNALYVDVQAAVDEYLTAKHTCIVSQDRVHPYERGAVLITRAWLQTVGFDFNRKVRDSVSAQR